MLISCPLSAIVVRLEACHCVVKNQTKENEQDRKKKPKPLGSMFSATVETLRRGIRLFLLV